VHRYEVEREATIVKTLPSTPSGTVEPGGDSLILADRAAAPDS
jgi:hypothetical protein